MAGLVMFFVELPMCSFQYCIFYTIFLFKTTSRSSLISELINFLIKLYPKVLQVLMFIQYLCFLLFLSQTKCIGCYLVFPDEVDLYSLKHFFFFPETFLTPCTFSSMSDGLIAFLESAQELF